MAYTTFTIATPEEGAEIQVTVTEDGNGNLQFDLELTSGTADLNGLFFDLADYNEAESSGVDVDSTNFHATDADTNEDMELKAAEEDVSNLGGGINVNGEIVKENGDFDVGVALDETGLGNSDDVQSISFVLDADQDLSLADILDQDFALRLTSVDEDGTRDGSLKLAGVADGPVMEDPEDLLDPEQPEGPTDSPADDGTATSDDTPDDGADGNTPDGTTDDTATDDTPTEPTSPDPLLDEWFAVQKDETAGDTDGDVLANDDPALTIVSVTNSGGETFAVAEGDTTIPGTEGGTLTAYPDGTVDFDAGEDFANLYDGESTDVVFTYTTDTDQTASVTVTVDGAGAPDDGMDDPVLPPIEDEGTADSTLDPEEPLLGDDVLLG